MYTLFAVAAPLLLDGLALAVPDDAPPDVREADDPPEVLEPLLPPLVWPPVALPLGPTVPEVTVLPAPPTTLVVEEPTETMMVLLLIGTLLRPVGRPAGIVATAG